MYFLVLAIGLFLMIIVHELGHLVCGFLSGNRFVSFRLFIWMWAKDDKGTIKFRKAPRSGNIAGQCLMEPCDEEKDFRFVLYNMGGGLANLVMGAITSVFFLIASNEELRFVLSLLVIANVIMGILNLIPVTVSGIPNDGRNVWEARKSDDARRGFFTILKAHAEMARGKHLSDYDKDAFSVREGADLRNYFVTGMLLLHSSQLEELGDYEKSYQLLLLPDTAKLPRYYGGQLILNLIFHELVYFGDELSVQRASSRMKERKNHQVFNKLLTTNPSFLPLQAALVAFIDCDTDKAKELITRIRDFNSSQQNPGLEHSVTLKLDKMEARIETDNRDDALDELEGFFAYTGQVHSVEEMNEAITKKEVESFRSSD